MNNLINCLDKGYVKLVSYGPLSIELLLNRSGESNESKEPKELKEPKDEENVTALEETIIRAARVSYDNDTKKYSKQTNLNLLEYLISMRHTSPFEMVEFVFEIKLPLSTAVHFLRHRTANVNMVSFRYIEAEKEEYYTPDLRLQDISRRQCSSSEVINEDKEVELKAIQEEMEQSVSKLFDNYQKLIKAGVAREVARFYLPNSTYTRMYWKLDLHNLLHFLSLRTADDSQLETRIYAKAISVLITPLVPNIISMYNKHHLESVSFSKDEIELLKKIVNFKKEDLSNDDFLEQVSKRKKELFMNKLNKIIP